MLRKAKPSKKPRAVELKWEGTFFSLFVQAIYAALGNRKFDLRPKWKSRVTTIYIRKYGLGFCPRFSQRVVDMGPSLSSAKSEFFT